MFVKARTKFYFHSIYFLIHVTLLLNKVGFQKRSAIYNIVLMGNRVQLDDGSCDPAARRKQTVRAVWVEGRGGEGREASSIAMSSHVNAFDCAHAQRVYKCG